MDTNGIHSVQEVLTAVLLRFELQVPPLTPHHMNPIYAIGSGEACRPDRLSQAHETAKDFNKGYSMTLR